MCHFNALFEKQLSATGVAIGAIAFFSPLDINSCSRTGALDVFSPYQYLRVYYLIKAWIICAFAICDTWCVFDANQKGRLMAATTDMANNLFAMGRMGWCFALWWRIVGSYDLRATVWSALSRLYHLHLRTTALAIGSEPVIGDLVRLGIMYCK